jgi:hypothetical protein
MKIAPTRHGRQRWVACGTILLLALMIAGCGDSDRATLVPVTGTVTQGGKPLAQADVMFLPERGAPSSGKTDANGQFTLMFNDGRPGAVVGKHKVLISVPGTTPPPPTGEEKAPARATPSVEFRQQAEVKPDGENKLTLQVGR